MSNKNTRNAYVLTCDEKSNRTVFSKKILEEIGFNVNLISCIKKGINKKEKILSNKIGMKHIYEIVKNSNNNYSYVFEDDINIVEKININEIIQYEEISSMFFYLGACSPGFPTARDTGVKINGHAVYSVCGIVKCLHAIGLSRSGADELLSFSEGKEEKTMDSILGNFSKKYCANIVRFDLFSPINKEHRGIIFQDRNKFPTTIF